MRFHRRNGLQDWEKRTCEIARWVFARRIFWRRRGKSRRVNSIWNECGNCLMAWRGRNWWNCGAWGKKSRIVFCCLRMDLIQRFRWTYGWSGRCGRCISRAGAWVKNGCSRLRRRILDRTPVTRSSIYFIISGPKGVEGLKRWRALREML